MPVLHGPNASIRPLNVYDCFSIAGPYSLFERGGYARLFGNVNIGNWSLTNLQVPGQLVADEPAAFNHWYARMNVEPGSLTEKQQASLRRFTCSTFVDVILGDKPQPQWHCVLADLLANTPCEEPPPAEYPRPPWPLRPTPDEQAAYRARFDARVEAGAKKLIVPVRQVIAIGVSAFQGKLHKLVEDLDWLPITIWIHLEGMSVRDCG